MGGKCFGPRPFLTMQIFGHALLAPPPLLWPTTKKSLKINLGKIVFESVNKKIKRSTIFLIVSNRFGI